MDNELWKFCMDAFCNQVRAIRSDVEMNGGFRSPGQLDDLKDCVSGVKNLHKIKAMASGQSPLVK